MIIDVFPYAAEATPPEVLLLRLHELRGVVDVHLVVEMDQTFTGHRRAQSWPELVQRPEFARLSPRVFGVMAEYPDGGMSAWGRDNWHRAACAQAVGHYLQPKDDDLVLFGDADEIPHPEALFTAAPGTKLLGRYHEWYLDLVAVGSPDHLWEFRQPALVTWAHLREYGGEHVRNTSGNLPAREGAPIGWHFTLQGGAEACARKLRAYAHEELGGITAERVQAMMTAERDVLGRCGLVSVPPSLMPRTIRRDPAAWEAMLLLRQLPAWSGYVEAVETARKTGRVTA